MNLKGLPAKKSMKFLALLLTSMLIASVSAFTYYSLTMSSTITVYAAEVYFIEGTDNNTGPGPVILTLDSTNTTATITGLVAYKNASLTYTNVTLVYNAGSTTPKIRIAPYTDPSTNADHFAYVKFLLNATNAVDRKWLNYTSDGSNWNSPSSATSWTTNNLGIGAKWPIVIMTKALANATTSVTVDIGITVDVQ